MCGITGAAGFGSLVDIPKYYEAHRLLEHRGPDDEGFIARSNNGPIKNYRGRNTCEAFRSLPDIKTLKSAEIVLGHHRLSVLDISERGHQPMFFEGLWLVYNGEIYNYRELRVELISRGYIFQTDSDTEVVLKAWHCWGEYAFNRFNGMWALAILDEKRDQVVLSRDRFGIKPLYFALAEKILFFASETKYFPKLLSLQMNEMRAAEYLIHGWTDHHRETILAPVMQLTPAHWMEINLQNGDLKTKRYWDIPTPKKILSEVTAATKQFGEIFNSSLDLRMRSDVPVGSLLSGGLDSTAILCNLSARQLLPEVGFHTYSAVFNETQYSEKKEIEETLKKCRTAIPSFVTYTPSDVIANLGEVIKIQDFPFRSLSVYSQYELYKYIAKDSKVTVLLNGQGADEIFGGYTEHLYTRISELLRTLKLVEAFRQTQKTAVEKNLQASQIAKVAILRLASHLKSLFADKQTTRDIRLNGVELMRRRVFDKDLFNNNLKVNLQFANLPEYLRYEDRNSMAFSKETRLPFLDYRLVEWAFSLAPELKIEDGVTKRIERLSVSSYSPLSIVRSKDKKGFISPQEQWQKNELQEWIQERLDIRKYSFIDQNSFSQSFSKSGGEWLKWRFACFNEWYDQYKK